MGLTEEETRMLVNSSLTNLQGEVDRKSRDAAVNKIPTRFTYKNSVSDNAPSFCISPREQYTSKEGSIE